MLSKSDREYIAKLESEAREISRMLAELKSSATAEIESLKKSESSCKASLEYARSQATKAENELDAAHALLDGLPQAPARETEGKETYQRHEIQLTTRLASWIAKVAFSEAFAKMGVK
jgi:chromosome segregation ATPase